jgi:hypothetical protein
MLKCVLAQVTGMLRTHSQLRFHTPSIKFRHVKGTSESSQATAAIASARAALPAAPEPAAAPTPVASQRSTHVSFKQFILQPSKATKQFYDLPEMYGRPPISAEEADAILTGVRL